MHSQRLGLRADSEELPRAYLRRALFVLSSGIRRESFTEIVRCRSRVDEGRERGKCNSSMRTENCLTLRFISSEGAQLPYQIQMS